MKELIIYEYQAKNIQYALRIAMNVLNTRNKDTETALDRSLLKAEQFIEEVLAKSEVKKEESKPIFRHNMR